MTEVALICEECNAIVNVINYRSHLHKVHHMNLSYDIDLTSKVLADKLTIYQRKNLTDEQRFYLEEKTDKWVLEKKLYYEKPAKERELERQRQLELERQKQKYIDDNAQIFKIIWDDIFFGKDKIKFEIKRYNVLKTVPYQGVFEALNTIKKEYFLRLLGNNAFTIAFFKGEVLFEKSPGWKKIIDTIEKAKEIYELKYLNLKLPTKIKRFNYLSNEEIIALFEKSFSKSPYLKFLASKQSQAYRIITINEYLNHHTEESFIFRLVTNKGNNLIIWGNVNLARATHIFISLKNEKKKTLDLVEEFICRPDIDTKRSLLYYADSGSKKIKEDLNYLKPIKHTSLFEYEIEIENLLNNI
ncbi:MAG: hypothetical protein HYU71_10445 [Bacteroidetes bacterium]|nr:hypothetical protein [Bacteroidota bacterium]